MEQQVISNKVYESLQVPTENTRTTTGKVLYANQYSGVAQVAMPNDLKELINSDFGLVGKNILVQLEQKMKGYINGPWYIDSRDGVIYIHNRKFHEEPVYKYTYQGENGEVLRISFTTQKVTKRTKVVLTSEINPDDKEIIIGSTNIKEPKEDKAKISPFITSIDNTQVVNYASDNVEDYRSSPSTNHKAEWDSNNTDWGANLQKVQDYKKNVALYDSKGPVAAYEAGKQEKFDSISTDEIRSAVNTAANELPEDKRRQLDLVLKNSKTGKELESNLKKLLEHEMYLYQGDDGMEFMVTEYVDPLDYDPDGFESYQAGAGMASVNYQGGVIPASNRGFEALKSDPYTVVLSGMESDTDRHYGRGQYGKKVKVRHMKRVNLKVPIYKLYHNLFSRYGGSDKYAWAMNANANGGLKHTERKLVCQMLVVGRPSLQSSQIIQLENVGNKWSGAWYIKQCLHQMDQGQGYTTQLDLVKNGSKDGSTTSKTGLSTQTIVANDAKGDAKTSKGKDKKAVGQSTLQLNFTYNEKVYYNTHFLDDKGVMKDIRGQGEFLRKKAYYTEVNANNPMALSEGIVTSTGTTVTSKGGVIPGEYKLKNIQVPEDYGVRFDYMNIASKVYKDIAAKNKRR